jgi:hypothetical protein
MLMLELRNRELNAKTMMLRFSFRVAILNVLMLFLLRLATGFGAVELSALPTLAENPI